MAAYFENFPLIRYGNTYARNITARVGVTSEVLQKTLVYYPYELKSEMRSDLLSHFYYDDSLSNWIFFISNNIIDPYYQWYNSNEEINLLIESKYGSLVKAYSGIHHWEVNWLNDESTLSSGVYNNLVVNTSTGVNQKKYWTPVYTESGQIANYKRKQLDLTVETNKFISFDINITSGNTFTSGERIIQTSGSVITASGFVAFQEDDDTLIIKNVAGTFSNASIITGEDSSTQASFTTANVISRSFPDQEASYWSPVSLYEYEFVKNEQKRTINVIDKKFLTDVEQNLVNALRE